MTGDPRGRGTPPLGSPFLVTEPVEGAQPDRRVVSSIRCTWWGAVGEESPSGRCPSCGSELMTHDSEEGLMDFAARVIMRHAKRGDEAHLPHHLAFVRWCRGRCFGSAVQARFAMEWHRRGRMEALRAAYAALVEGLAVGNGVATADRITRTLRELWDEI